MHGGTPYPQALDLPLSLVRAYFESPVHQQKVKADEGSQKLDLAVVGRLDSVVRAIVMLGKSIRR